MGETKQRVLRQIYIYISNYFSKQIAKPRKQGKGNHTSWIFRREKQKLPILPCRKVNSKQIIKLNGIPKIENSLRKIEKEKSRLPGVAEHFLEGSIK